MNASAACVHVSGLRSASSQTAGNRKFSGSSYRFGQVKEFGCERGYAASAANSLAQLAFFNGLLENFSGQQLPHNQQLPHVERLPGREFLDSEGHRMVARGLAG